MKSTVRPIGVGVAIGLIASLPGFAGATVSVNQINCTATTLLGPVALRQPFVANVTGPVWAAKTSAVTLNDKPSATVLPSAVGPATVGSYQDLVNKFQIVGTASTVVTTGTIPGLVFQYDPDLADNGGIPNPVPMDGVATYGPYGPFAAPTVVVTAPLPLVGVAGTYDVTMSLDPGAGSLPVAGSIGGGIFLPNIPYAITNTGTVDGQIQMIATSTSVTANVTAPLATSAVTSCAPSADPLHVVNIQTDGGPIVPASPVIACDPANNTVGVFKDAKGWWTGDTNATTATDYGGSFGGTTRFDGCIAPDARLAAWVLSKNGAATADSLALAKADISIKSKQFGNCTLVDELSPAGLAHAADSPQAYENTGTLSTKYLTSANVTSKVKGSTAAVAIRLVIDTTSGAALPEVRLEANGIVTKGTGLGGELQFVAELDTSIGQTSTLGIIGCNTAGYSPPAVGKFLGNTAPYLNLKTGDNAVLQISAP